MEMEAEMAGSTPEDTKTPTNEGATVLPGSVQDLAGTERGEPSEHLRRALESAKSLKDGGVLDTGDGPGSDKRLTEAMAEKGVFTVVGGYIDEDGVIHNEVQLRAMSGHEEDLLGNRAVPAVQRMNGIMANCIERLGNIVDRGKIAQAVHEMPSGTRTDLLIALRMATHWAVEKDVYRMNLRCPISDCQQEREYKVSLLDLPRYDDYPEQRLFEIRLPVSGDTVVWKVLGSKEDHALNVVGRISEAEGLSYAILVRVVSVNGENVQLHPQVDLLDRQEKKLKLSKQAKELLLRVKNWPSPDRDALRADFFDKEPGVDTDVEVECQVCHRDFQTQIDVGQASFFFPQVTSMRSKRRRSS